jgi:GNAT superfamily N-acetyltransferase
MDLQDFLRDDAIEYLRQHLAHTYLGWQGDNLVGFFTLSCGILKLQEFARAEAANAGLDGIQVGIPGVLLGRLATGDRYVGRGIGGWMFREAVGIARNDIAPVIGARFLFIDARANAIGWYGDKFGCRILGEEHISPRTTKMGFDLFPPAMTLQYPPTSD